MSTKITSPIEGFDGRTVFGPLAVEFKNGVAETDQKIGSGLKAYLTGRGYKVGKGTTEGAHPDGAPTDTWKVDELKAYATAHDVDLGSATTKADIVKAIESAAVDSGPAAEAASGDDDGEGDQGDGGGEGDGGDSDGS